MEVRLTWSSESDGYVKQRVNYVAVVADFMPILAIKSLLSTSSKYSHLFITCDTKQISPIYPVIIS